MIKNGFAKFTAGGKIDAGDPVYIKNGKILKIGSKKCQTKTQKHPKS